MLPILLQLIVLSLTWITFGAIRTYIISLNVIYPEPGIEVYVTSTKGTTDPEGCVQQFMQLCAVASYH